MTSFYSFKSFTYRLPDGSFPRYHGAVLGDAIWIAVGKLRLLDIPWKLLQKERPRDDPATGLVKTSGLVTDTVRLLSLPASFSKQVWWRAFQPTYPTKGDRWFMVSSVDDILERLDMRETYGSSSYFFPPVLSKEIIKDCRTMEDDLESIRAFSTFPPQTTAPVLPRLLSLHNSYPFIEDILLVYTELLCYYWGGQGIFRWWDLQNELYTPHIDWKARLPALARERVRRWSLERFPCRGVIVNLATDRLTTDLNLMIHAEVGFTYRWTRGLQEDARYTRWSPEYLARLVLFSSTCEIEGIALNEQDFARQHAGLVRTVTSYDFSLSRVEAVVRPPNLFLNIVKVVNKVTNAYFVLVEGWEPLAIDTNLEWNALARHFQVNLTKKSDFDGTVYVAISQRPYADSILPDGVVRRHISQLFCSWEFTSQYWTVPRIQKWIIHGMHSPSLVVIPTDRRHGAILADVPHYPPAEFDELLFRFFLPVTHRWRLEELRGIQPDLLMSASFESNNLLISSSAPPPASPQRPPTWKHSVVKNSSDELLDKRDKVTAPSRTVNQMNVRLRNEFGGQNGHVRDDVGNRLLWRVIGHIERKQAVPMEGVVGKEQSTPSTSGSENGRTAPRAGHIEKEQGVPAGPSVSSRFRLMDETHFSLTHRWNLENTHRNVAQVILDLARLNMSWQAEMVVKLLLNRMKKPPSAKELLLLMIEHGIPFELSGQTSDLVALRGSRPLTTSLSPDNDLLIFATMHCLDLKRAFKYNQGAECGAEWLAMLRRIETLDSASSLTSMGSVLGYIVRRYMPQLVDLFLEGFSPQTTVWRSGASTIRQGEGKELLWDEPSRNLINLVVGLRYDEVNPDGASIFPHPDWYEADIVQPVRASQSMFLWSPWLWESNFFSQMQHISSGIANGTVKVKTRSQWSRLFRSNRKSKIPWDSIVDELDSLCKESYGGRWAYRPLTDLQMN